MARSSERSTPSPGPGRGTPPPSPRWLVPVMVGAFVVGVLWLVAYYLTDASAPVFGTWGSWNLLVGLGFLMVGLGLATRWR